MSASRRAASTAAIAATAVAAMAWGGLTAANAQAAPAQPPEAPPAAWRVECSGDGKTLECRAVQQVYHRESRQLLVSLAVKPAADGKTGAMIVQLPLGLNLTEPIMLKVDNGAPEGNAADAPAALKFDGGWALGQPDLVLSNSQPYTPPATGDMYRCFTMPTNLTSDQYVAAVDVKPGDRKSVV